VSLLPAGSVKIVPGRSPLPVPPRADRSSRSAPAFSPSTRPRSSCPSRCRRRPGCNPRVHQDPGGAARPTEAGAARLQGSGSNLLGPEAVPSGGGRRAGPAGGPRLVLQHTGRACMWFLAIPMESIIPVDSQTGRSHQNGFSMSNPPGRLRASFRNAAEAGTRARRPRSAAAGSARNRASAPPPARPRRHHVIVASPACAPAVLSGLSLRPVVA